MFLAKVIVFCFAVLITQCKSDCSVSILSLTDILPTDNSGQNIIYPDENGEIVTKNGKSITLGCPGGRIVFKKNKNVNFNIEYSEFKCTYGEYVSMHSQFQNRKIEELTCDALQPVEKLERKNGFCDTNINSNRVVIGFQFKDKTFIPQIEVCWNDVKKTPLYALATVKYIPNGWKAAANRPFFRTGNFFQEALKKYYSPQYQMYNLCKTFNSIPAFITPEIVENSLLDKGHLVAKADFPLEAQQGLTFQYTNVGPQWGSFNKQNWEQIETKIRNFVVTGKSDLSVYTGTSGIFKMVDRDYYLHENKPLIPVPKYFWKIVLKQTVTNTYSGVAILGLNDIFATTVTDPCKNVMSSVTWLNIPTANNIKSGYVIACQIKDFVKIAELNGVLPTLPVSPAKISLLKY